MTNLTADFLLGLSALRFEDLPQTVLATAKRNILDTLLVARAGSRAEGIDALINLAEAEAKPGPCVVWAHDCVLPPAFAAQINAMAAAALDFDSLCLTVHADCIIVPVAFAVAEACGGSGRALLAAYVAGAEMMARLSRAAEPPQKGWTHTAVFGVFGAALTAARLLGLSDVQTKNAIGICLSLAAGSQQSNIEQVLTKRLQPALAARNGIFAAFSARAGITGPASVFDGKAGLWSLYQAADSSRLLDGLGHDFVMLQTALKKYPVCACSHAAIEACLELSNRQCLRADEIESLGVTLTPFMTYMVGGLFKPEENPVVAAQFSVRYAMAAALLRGHVDLSDLAFDAIANADTRRLAERITIHTDEKALGEVEPATVHLKLAGQDERTLTVTAMPGGASAPLSSDAFNAKLMDCERAQPFDTKSSAFLRLRQTVERLEELDNISHFTALLGGASVQADARRAAAVQ